MTGRWHFAPAVLQPNSLVQGKRKIPWWRILIIGAVAGCLQLAGGMDTAFAQNIDPGVLQQRLIQQRPRPKATAPIPIPETVRPGPPPGSERIRFVLNEVQLFGNEALPAEEFRPLWSKMVGREISIIDLYEIAALVTVFYRSKGYILSRAIVPPQEIENGVVEIEVIEGFIDNVVIEGDADASAFQIKRKIDGIKASKPLHVRDIERYLLLLNDLPGVSVASVVRPSLLTPGASELVIIMEETPVSGSLSLDNLGTRFIGPFEQSVTLRFSNLFDVYDSTDFRIVKAHNNGVKGPRELRFFSVSHSELLTAEGTTISLIGSRILTNPRSTLKVLEIEGRSTQLAVSLTHPFVRSRSENFAVRIGLTYLDSEIETRGDLTQDDRTRWWNVLASSDFVDQFRGVNLLQLEYQQGINIFGNRKSSREDAVSRVNGRSDFSLLTADILREQDLGLGWSLLAEISGQYSFSQLLAAQEFGFGGSQFGRGYDPSEISGDSGIASKLELRFGRGTDLDFLETYQLFGFIDFGAVWRIDKDRLPGGVRDSAYSGGVGVRVNFSPKVFGSLEIAQPLSRRPTSSRDDLKRQPTLLFRITSRM
ncbi:MAG: hypothetical protein O7B81_09975 [Gammaproteobacteria bacterium]|nr:hypothetical protein [Gammaproteobacteria bacterium]